MDLVKFSTDHWDFLVGTVIGIAGVWVALAQRNPKTLDYSVLSNVPILRDRTERINSELEINYRDTQLKDPRLVIVRIANTGRRAVEQNDYVEPITVQYEHNPPLGFTEAEGSSPNIVGDDIGLVTASDSAFVSRVEVRPKLLNPRDWFDLQLLSDGDPGKIGVHARFSDQRRAMQDFEGRSTLGRVVGLRIVVPLIAVVLLTSILFAAIPRIISGPAFILTLIVAFTVGLLSAAGASFLQTYRRPWKGSI